VALNPSRTVDGQRVADVTFTGVALAADALLGTAGGAQPHIDEAHRLRHRAAVCRSGRRDDLAPVTPRWTT
jgi:hypothetical protein